MANDMKSKSRKLTEEAELETAYRNISGKKGRYAVKRTTHTPMIVAVAVALLAVLIAICACYVYFLNADMDGIIIENVFVAGVDVGGMTQADAIDAVRAATKNTYSTKPMVVKVLDAQAEIPAKYVGTLDVRKAVKAAYKFGNSGTQSQKDRDRNLAATSGYHVDITPYLDLKEKDIRNILTQMGENYNTTLRQSSYEITGTAPSQTLVITLGIPEYGFNLDQLYQQVMASYNANTFVTEGTCTMIEPDPIDLDNIHSQVYVAPTDAFYDPKTNTVQKGTDGYGFDLDSAKKQLSEAKFGATIEISIGVISPKQSAEDIQNLLFRDELASYTGAFASDPNRDINLQLACQAINGKILNPGDAFSFLDVVGDTTAARGYKLCASCAGNGSTNTYSGGICQVSSALYYCALASEMQIIMRTNHDLLPSYIPVGFDANVCGSSVDFRFKNNSDYPVRIEATASGGKTTVTIVGTDLREYRVALEDDILSTTEYTTTYKFLPADNAQGYRDGDYITEPCTGHELKTYLSKYSKDSEELISRDFIADSVYRKRDAVICQIEDSGSDNNNQQTGNPGISGSDGITDSPGALP